MIKVLLVDDELPGRMMVRSLIDWEKEGYVICGECSDGRQAWEAIPKLRPQIVITDVKMEHMNGDELVRLISEKYPQICTIVLSGYDDYEYVRDVLKHNAIDYLIKNNLTSELLLDSLHKAEEIYNIGPQIKKSASNLGALQRQFVLKLLGGEYQGRENEIEGEMRELSISLDYGRVMPLLLVISNLDEKINGGTLCDKMLIVFSVCNVLEEIIREEDQGIAVPIENNEILIMISLKNLVSERKMQEGLKRILNRSSFCMDKFMGLKANIHIGRPVRLENLQDSFREMEKRRQREFLDVGKWADGTGAPFEADDREYNDGNGLRLEDEKRLLNAVRETDEKAVQNIISRIFKEIYEHNILRSGCTQLFSDLVILTISFCKKEGIPYEKIYSRHPGVMEYISQMEKLKDCRDFFLQLFLSIVEEKRALQIHKDYSLSVIRSIRYIRQNYTEAISLTDAAETIGMNASYLSTLFKTEVGIGFTEYLNDFRLEKAKEYMHEPERKLKDIITRCGFYSYPYFFSLFKKKYGLTPKEYRKKYLKTEESGREGG